VIGVRIAPGNSSVGNLDLEQSSRLENSVGLFHHEVEIPQMLQNVRRIDFLKIVRLEWPRLVSVKAHVHAWTSANVCVEPALRIWPY
jgi:hypothetical protein